MLDKKHIAFAGRLMIVGFGSIGQGVLPLLLRHLEIAPDQITIITAEPRGHDVAAEYGIRFLQTPLTQNNYRAMLEPQFNLPQACGCLGAVASHPPEHRASA